MDNPTGDPDAIRQLLASLNHWEQTAGTTYAADPRLKSTGEANARIADLKRQLAARGAVYHWNGREYVLDAIETPGRGRQGPDDPTAAPRQGRDR